MKVRALCMAVISVIALTNASLAETEPREIVVVGEGTASAAPDMAVIDFGVTAQAVQAQAAMDEVSADVRLIFQAILDYGVAPRDIQTTALRLNPVWDNRPRDAGGAPEITGFVATNSIRVRLRDMTSLGAVLQSALDEGANHFSSIQFTLADPEPLRAEARRDAVADAAAKAALYAEAAGVTLGPVQSIVEAAGPSAGPVMLAEARFASDGGVPVAGGELDINARVTITYTIAE